MTERFALGDAVVVLMEATELLLRVYLGVLLARGALTWLNPNPRNPLLRAVVFLTEPPRRLVHWLLPRALRELPLDVAFLLLFVIVAVLREIVEEATLGLGTI